MHYNFNPYDCVWYLFWNFIRKYTCVCVCTKYINHTVDDSTANGLVLPQSNMSNSKTPVHCWLTSNRYYFDLRCRSYHVDRTKKKTKNKTNRPAKVMRMCCSGKRMLKPLQQPAVIHRKSFTVFLFFFLCIAFVRIAHMRHR